ncbi:helix-turn-helix domain-containing protein [Kitasatospora sp. NPDC048365]|uniref:helix-turn-helix transcriptional regulator n=1 Tax=Kitasatospora sp. NPDC048365 TaxID=3364050 RepID=UPI003720838F
MLAPFGISESDEQLYREVLGRSAPTLAELAEATGREALTVRRRLRVLENCGLVVRVATRPVSFRSASPELAVGVLARRRHQEIEQARAASAELSRLWQGAVQAREAPVQVVHGREAGVRRFLQTQLAARAEVLTFDRPPYVEEGVLPQLDAQLEAMARGVRYRTVYDKQSLAGPGQIERAWQLSQHGEQARVLDGVPLKMLIVDGAAGLVPSGPLESRQTLVLQESPLLTGLGAMFECLWERATPLWTARGAGAGAGVGAVVVGTAAAGADATGERLLGYAAAGYTDAAIARRTGMSKRTVERRMRRLMESLGAQTRFQAGLQAARRGLLG